MTELTPEELDDARAVEAGRIYNTGHSVFPRAERTATIAARLAREGWMPPPKVDPDIEAMRKILKAETTYDRNAIDLGNHDHSQSAQLVLAGIKHGRANP